MQSHNKALVRTFTTLRFVHAAQLCRYVRVRPPVLFAIEPESLAVAESVAGFGAT